MRTLFLPFLLTAVLATTACGDDNDPVNPLPGISITLAQPSAAVLPGSSIAVPITLSRTGGFTGSMTLTAENVPAGITASFEPSTLASDATTSTLTLTAVSGATAGGTITIRASGSGVAPRTQALPVTIATSGILLVSGATAVSAAQGGAVAIPIVLSRVGSYTGDVTLTAEGVPTGVTAVFSPLTLTGTTRTTTLLLTPTSTAAAGSSNITIRGSGVNIGPSTQTVAVTITPSTTAGFGLASAPAAMMIQAGQSMTSALTITRTSGFAEPIAPVASGAPAGMTISFNPTSATDASTVTVTTTTATAPGTYQILLQGSTTGSTTATGYLTVIVVAAGA
jgi:hypothetical protein